MGRVLLCSDVTNSYPNNPRVVPRMIIYPVVPEIRNCTDPCCFHARLNLISFKSNLLVILLECLYVQTVDL